MNVAVFGAAGWLGRAVLENFQGKHDIRAVDRGPEAWEAGGPWNDGEIIHADIADFDAVHKATEGMDGIVHLAVYSSRTPDAYGVKNDQPFLINLKGLWNTLESARLCGIQRVVHMGSCQTVHPNGVFFSSDVRRPDGSLYAVTKRLQEEMCRQFHDALDLRIIVLRADGIVDSRLGIGKDGKKLDAERRSSVGWVCRYDLAEAFRLALESQTIDFDIFHIVGTPEADTSCNVARSREVLGLQYRGNLEQYRR